MLQYILTGLAGIALGIVAMRVWQARDPASATADDVPADPAQASLTGNLGSSRNLLIGAAALVAGAAAVLVMRGGTSPSASPAATAPAGANQQIADVDTMISKLAARLEKEPNDGEGFRMLGWSYLMTGRPQQAIAPFKRALELLPDQATVHSGYGEALVGVAAGKVTPEAKAAFDQALRRDPKEPRARYFIGLWHAQNGRGKEALALWIELANSGPADAPWQPEVQAKIRDEAAKQGVDVSSRLKVAAAASPAMPVQPGPAQPDPAKAAAISQLPPEQQQASIDGMVSGLAARLKSNPKDAKGWSMLFRSRMVLKQDKQAAADLAAARSAFSGDAAGLAEVNAAAKAAGVPGA
ncbi:MAG: tetratricopeptide repeat protein [Novosphingobium sp.]|uniref:tetratricopeptide repeat protein n=1 Tax=Novosphingobium sp. TaxID=1874826 RepID=UPI0032BA7D10